MQDNREWSWTAGTVEWHKGEEESRICSTRRLTATEKIKIRMVKVILLQTPEALEEK
jgi:hypothetical protein